LRSLSSIENFGNIDATLDTLLEDCFEEHSSFKEIKDFRKFIVIGKKGTGKTAIFSKILKTSSFDTFCEGYNLTSYPWYHHDLQAKSCVPDNEKFIHSWEYLLLLSISKLLITSDEGTRFDTDSKLSRNVLEKFIVDTYGTVSPDLTHIFTPNKKIKLKNLFSAKVAGQELQIQLPFETVEMKDLPTVVQDVNKSLLYHVMKCAHPEHKYFICFDELDIGFDKTKENYFNSIIGLIRAAREINLEARKKNKKLLVCIFLRDDIYNLLRFEDKRKITDNFVTLIEWDNPQTDNTLKELMEKRFEKLLRENNNEVIKWEDVFDDLTSINGNRSKYNYITDMTCLRPRDMIDICNSILNEHKKRAQKVGNIRNIFENPDITSAKDMYSSSLLREFDDEVHKHIPNYERYIDIIKKIGKSKFSYQDFENTYEVIKDRVGIDKDPLQILQDLFTFSIIGNYMIGGKTGGSRNLFRYKDCRAEFRDDLKIIIHPGLATVLGLKEK
jgi:hypothetical protein